MHLWLNTVDAGTLVGVSPVTVRSWIKKYLVRSYSKGSHLYIYVEDLEYCKQMRAKKLRPSTLFVRGLLPRRYQEVPGNRIIEEAVLRKDLEVLKDLPLPEDIHPLSEEGCAATEEAEEEAAFETVQDTRERLQRLESQVQALLGVLHAGSSMRGFSDSECGTFLEELRDLLGRPLLTEHLEKWSRVLSRLTSEHLQDLARWEQNFPERAQKVRVGDLPVYGVVVKMAARMDVLADALPGGRTAGSATYYLRARVRKAREHVEDLCVAHAAVARASRNQKAVVPPGYSRTDQYILERLSGNRSRLQS